MYTGYYAKIKEYKEAGLIPVSIAGKAPDWYDGLEYKKLAPKWEFFNEWKNGSHKGDNEYYISHFKKEVLDRLSVPLVISTLMGMTNTIDNVILLCYEKPGDFCHRHLVADWINGYEGKNFITEYVPPIKLDNYPNIKKTMPTSVEKIGKNYKLIYNAYGGAYTLSSTAIGTHEDNGWTVKGIIHSDCAEWVNDFTASKNRLWVKGDFEDTVECSSLRALENFLEYFEPEMWDYMDI